VHELPSDRRLPESLRLPEGSPDLEDLLRGALPDDAWCARVAIDLSPDLLVIVDPLMRAVWTNGAVERVLGIPRGEMLGMDVSSYVHPDDLVVALGAINEVQRADGYHVATRIRVLRWDRTYLDTRVTATTITAGDGVWMVLALRPVEDEVAVERRRAQLKALAQSVYVECAAMHWFELGDRVTGMLGALGGVVGARTAELVEPRDGGFVRVATWARDGEPPATGLPTDVVADVDRLRNLPCVVSTVDGPAEIGSSMVVELWLDREGIVRLSFDGYTETWDDANADVVAPMCSTMLATMRRCEQESENNTRANRDPLTRLLNRRALDQRLAEIMSTARPDRPPVVLFADLNRFKQMNDRFGHREGDAVLCRVADALSSQIRADDVAARIGGDEFVVVLGEGDAPVDALVERIRGAVNAALEPWPDVSVAVGAIVVRPGDSPEEILDRADRAMYADKARHRSGVRDR
jgi:diguanylate cyclase (GGDEF)-like protein